MCSRAEDRGTGLLGALDAEGEAALAVEGARARGREVVCDRPRAAEGVGGEVEDVVRAPAGLVGHNDVVLVLRAQDGRLRGDVDYIYRPG